MDIDYSQTFIDHSKILINVEQIGQSLSSKKFNIVYDQISVLTHAAIPNTGRTLRFRFTKHRCGTASRWQKFQAHRRIYGLICLVVLPEKVEEQAEALRSAKETYAKLRDQSNCLDSRLIIYGSHNTKKKNKLLNINNQGPFDDPLSASLLNFKDQHQNTDFGSDKFSDTFVQIMSTSNLKAVSSCIQTFFESLYWYIENERSDKVREKYNHQVGILYADAESKDIAALDNDCRLFRKRYRGRQCKYTADLCLLNGLPGEAILSYETALEHLRQCNDTLWIAGCLEGLCAATIVKPFQRNNSYNSTLSSIASQRMPIIGVPNAAKKMYLETKAGRSHQYAALPNAFIDNCKIAVSSYSSFTYASSLELECCFKSSRILIKFGKRLEASELLRNVVFVPEVNNEDKEMRFRLLASLYHEMEMFRKQSFFLRILAMQIVDCKKMNKDEQVNTLDVKMWNNCYQELLRSFHGFKLLVNPKDMKTERVSSIGWISIHLRVIHEIIYAAKKVNDIPLIIRHLTFLLEIYHRQMRPEDMVTCTNFLENIARRTSGCVQKSLSVDDIILPPVHLISFPYLISFQLKPLDHAFRPIKIKKYLSPAAHNNVFIYSPIQKKHRRHGEGHDSTIHTEDFTWVEDQQAIVVLRFSNIYNFPLNFSIIDIICKDLDVVATPTLQLVDSCPAHIDVYVRVTPRGVGCLRLCGYVCNAFNIRSECLFSDRLRYAAVTGNNNNDNTKEDTCDDIKLYQKYEIKVIDKMPIVTLKPSNLNSHSISMEGERFKRYERYEGVQQYLSRKVVAGERCTLILHMENSSEVQVDQLDCEITSLPGSADIGDCIKFSADAVLGANSTGTMELSVELPTHLINEQTDLELLVEVTYSNNEMSYGRRIIIALILEAEPSFVISSIFRINQSDEDITLQIEMNQLFSEQCRLSYCSGWVNTTENTLITLNASVEKLDYNKYVKYITSSAAASVSSADSIFRYLNDAIAVRWKGNTNGLIDLTKHFTEKTFLDVTMYKSPYSIDISVAGSAVTESPLTIKDNVIFIECALSLLKSKLLFENVHLEISVQKENSNINIDFIGCNTLFCKQLLDETYISCGIIFSESGEYIISLRGYYLFNRTGDQKDIKIEFPNVRIVNIILN